MNKKESKIIIERQKKEEGSNKLKESEAVINLTNILIFLLICIYESYFIYI